MTEVEFIAGGGRIVNAADRSRSSVAHFATAGPGQTCTCAVTQRVPAQMLCVALVALQGAVLDYYLSTWQPGWFAWIIADMIVSVGFLSAFTMSHKYLQLSRQDRLRVKQIGGELPLGYWAWAIYSGFLAARIAIIFKHFAFTLSEKDFFGPNTLKTTLALSAVIYFLLVLTHHDCSKNSARHVYIEQLTGGVPVDLLDTVTILDNLFLKETQVLLTFHMHNAIIAVACINIILPTLPLVVLSNTKFGRGKLLRKALHTLHTVFYMMTVNIPLLVLRLLLWHVHSQDISVFILKNLFYIGKTIHSVYLDIVEAKQGEYNAADGTDVDSFQAEAHDDDVTDEEGTRDSADSPRRTHNHTQHWVAPPPVMALNDVQLDNNAFMEVSPNGAQRRLPTSPSNKSQTEPSVMSDLSRETVETGAGDVITTL